MLEELLQKYDDAVMESNAITESPEWVAYTNALTALDRANAELALIKDSVAWKMYLSELDGAKRAYEIAVNALKTLEVYQQHERATQAVTDAETATLLNIPLSVTETVTSIKGAK